MIRKHLIACIVVLACATRLTAAAAAEPDAFADNACVQCHRDLPGRSSEIVDLEWKHSVHFSAKVGCEGCHGGNAAVRRQQFASDEQFKSASHQERNAEFLLMRREGQLVTAARGRSVSYLCGKCHQNIKEHHLGSPHGEFGQPNCLYCHGAGSHRIERASLDIIDTRPRAESGRCSPCHRAATMESVARVKKLLTETEARIKAAGEQYKFLENAGYRSLELEGLNHHAGEARSQVRQIFHSFNMRDIAKLTAEVEAVADRTTAAYQLVQRLRTSQRQQTAVGASAVLFLLGFTGLLIYYKHTFLVHGGMSAAAPRSHLHPGGMVSHPALAEEVGMNPAPPPAGKPGESASFPRLGICFMFLHFGVAIFCLIFGTLFSRGGSSDLAAVGQLLCWPLQTFGSAIEHDHHAMFWPLMLVNSALWGLALAALAYPLVRWWSGRSS